MNKYTQLKTLLIEQSKISFGALANETAEMLKSNLERFRELESKIQLLAEEMGYDKHFLNIIKNKYI